MKSINRVYVGLFLVTLTILPVSLRAESVGFPKDSPAFTVEVPAGWKAEYIATPDSLMLADASLSNSFMAVAMAERHRGHRQGQRDCCPHEIPRERYEGEHFE